MSLLNTEPPAPLRSLGELFALALRLETEAAERYAALVPRMQALDLPDLAELFQELEAEERSHAGHVEEWAHMAIGGPPDPSALPWEPPETFATDEELQFASSNLASAYRVLSMAVRNEERAFALWTYIAAQAEMPAIQAAAERMASEELRHAALLRRARRHAFHAERDHPSSGLPRLPPIAEAAQAERGLSTILPALAGGDGTDGETLRDLAAMTAAMAKEAADLAESGRDAVPGETQQGGLHEALRLSERAAEAYLAAADTGRDEVTVSRLQRLAERAIGRLAMLRRLASGP